MQSKKIHVPKILQQELILQQQHKLGIFIGMFKKNYMLSDIYYRGLWFSITTLRFPIFNKTPLQYQ